MILKKQNRFNKKHNDTVSNVNIDKKRKHSQKFLGSWFGVKEKISKIFDNLKNLIVGLNILDTSELTDFISDSLSQIRELMFDKFSDKKAGDKEKIPLEKLSSVGNSKNKENVQYSKNFSEISYDNQDLSAIDFNGVNDNKSCNMVSNNIKAQRLGISQLPFLSYLKKLKLDINNFSEMASNCCSLLSNNNYKNSINKENILQNLFLGNKTKNNYRFNANKNIFSEIDSVDYRVSTGSKKVHHPKADTFDYSKIVPHIIGKFLDVPLNSSSLSELYPYNLKRPFAELQQTALVHNKIFEIENNKLKNDINELSLQSVKTSLNNTNRPTFESNSSAISSLSPSLYESPHNNFVDREQMEEFLRCTLDDFIIRMGFDMHDYN